MKFTVTFFRTARGDQPVADYIREVPEKERGAIDGLLVDLRNNGRLEYPHGRKMVGYKNLYEIRYKRHRIFYFYHGTEIILTHAFKKQSKETPKKEIDVALGRMNLWEKLKEKEE